MNPDLQKSLEWFDLPGMEGVGIHELKSRYHLLAQKYHPDKGGNGDDFIRLREAYTFLQHYITNPHRSSPSSESISDIDSIKEELDRYRKAFEDSQAKIRGYENMIGSQVTMIADFQKDLSAGIDLGRSQESQLRAILDDELAKLKKQYDSGWWKGFIGMQVMSEQTYNIRYNALVDEYNSIRKTQDTQYIDNLLQIYRGLVSRIIDTINTV